MTLKDKIIEHLKHRTDKLKQSIRDLNEIVIKQQNKIRDLEQYLTPPQYKEGDIVSIIGYEDKQYRVDCAVTYDVSYPIYNLINVEDEDDVETTVEIDIYN